MCRTARLPSALAYDTPRMAASTKPVGDNPRYERWRWQIFAVTWLAYAGLYLTRKSFSVAKIGAKSQIEVIDHCWPSPGRWA